MESQEFPIKPAISRVSVVTYNGWLERFGAVSEAIDYVSTLSRYLDDPDDPMDCIRVQIEFGDGTKRTCPHKDKQKILQWMRGICD